MKSSQNCVADRRPTKIECAACEDGFDDNWWCDACMRAYRGVYNAENRALVTVLFHNVFELLTRSEAMALSDWEYRRGKAAPDLAGMERRYALLVRRISWCNYRRHVELLNPDNHKIGRSGERGAWQLDHVAPVGHCFEAFVRPEVAAAVSNLQVVPWRVNQGRAGNFDPKHVIGVPRHLRAKY